MTSLSLLAGRTVRDLFDQTDDLLLTELLIIDNFTEHATICSWYALKGIFTNDLKCYHAKSDQCIFFTFINIID